MRSFTHLFGLAALVGALLLTGCVGTQTTPAQGSSPANPALPVAVPAQTPALGAAAQAPTAAQTPPANPADVASVDAILAALYDVISGPAGQARDWNRMRSLFVPGARLIPTVRPQAGGADVRMLSVEDYIARVGPRLEADGFFEREIARRTESFGNIAHAFSTYESRHRLEDPQPFARGINSIQLFNDGTRWWVVNVFWDSERPGASIPPAYLPGRNG